MNERLKAEIKKQYPEMVVEYEYNGEVQFYTSPSMAEKGDDTYLKCGIFRGGRLEILHEW